MTKIFFLSLFLMLTIGGCREAEPFQPSPAPAPVFSPGNALADQDSGQERNGGDIEFRPAHSLELSPYNFSFRSRAEMQKYILDPRGLKADTVFYIQHSHPLLIFDGSIRGTLHVLRSSAGLNDVKISNYTATRACYDSTGVEHDASAVANHTNAIWFFDSVCFNSLRLYLRAARRFDLVALAVHEHSHHFGVADLGDFFPRYPLLQFVQRTAGEVFYRMGGTGGWYNGNLFVIENE